MNRQFILSCGSTVDMPYAYMQEREIPVIFYTYTVDDEVCIDNMGRDADALPNFYRQQAENKRISTSQLNEQTYIEFFENLLQQGDVLHIAFGSGMSASVNNAFSAAKKLNEKYSDRSVRVIDSLCSSSGYGLLV
ncbi:MAG: DegV family protein, partial [Christensenellaceae bacterium]|nr:DegV family protein [Christensenellaceae bacterium]